VHNTSSNEFHVGRPNLPDEKIVLDKFSEVLQNKWLTNNGPMVEELESKIEKYLGVNHCICVCNATIGLELLQRALDLKGEVIIPSFTFIATAHSLRWQRIDPVFCDVRMEDHLIDPDKIESLITSKTTGILGVPIWGQPCDYKKLKNITEKYGLKLIFDSAHAFGCKTKDQYLGGFGDAEVFSFHATKVFSTGEGGAITTNSNELAQKLRLMRNFGFTDYDQTDHLGTNAKMSEFAAAYGLIHFEDLECIVQYNKRIYEAYQTEFSSFSEFQILDYSFKGHSNYQYVVASVPAEIRDPLVKHYHSHGVLVRRYFYPGCHQMEPYSSQTKYRDIKLPITDKISSNILILPTGKQMTETNVKEFSNIYSKFRKI
jgi:dTDP-4-amino-4,6-dideoxygalactose transaminase